MAKCPICDAAVKARKNNPSFPFCAVRCKTIDLGKWMSEEYRIPLEDTGEDDEGDGGASSKTAPDGQAPVRH